MRIVLLGGPGSGKGTQASQLAAHFRVRHIGVGDLLRGFVAQSDCQSALRTRLDDGDLVDDETVFGVVWPHVLAATEDGGYVLDGYPRTLSQAETAHVAARRGYAFPDVVVYLHAPRAVLVDRLTSRTDHRSDDSIAVIAHRQSVFEHLTEPLVKFYEDRDLLVRCDATKPVDAVTADILTSIDARNRRSSVGGVGL